MTMIPDEKKEEVRQAADIVDVVSDHVKLRRSGSNFTGLCPFHNEKTPSFSVSPKLGIYKCFGCGEGGDVFNFVMNMDGVGFEEAVRTLAERYNIVIPEKEQDVYDPRQHLKDGIYHALRFAGNFYHQTLAESDEAEKARNYLKKREYPWKTVRKYGLGFAPDRYEGLLKAAENTGINIEYLHESGLIKPRERGDGYYDTFRSRLMFPIFNPSGKVIAFGGRTLSESKKIPKYINSPQTPVYNKSEVLYGIQIAKNEIRKADEVMLVEGYTDVISMHQAGIGNVVSTSGTSLTAGQIRIMKRYGDVLLMIFDADTAGMQAAVRGVIIALEGGMAVRVLTLPEGEDPDSFIRQFGKEGFAEYKKEETSDFLRFLVNLAIKEERWDDPVDRKNVITDILETIAVIPDELSRVNYIQELSTISRLGDRTLREELEVIRSRERKKSDSRSRRMTASYSSASGPGSTAGKGSAFGPGSSSGPGSVVDPGSSTGPDSAAGQEGSGSSARPEGPPHPAERTISSNRPSRPVRRPEYEKELLRLMLTFGERLILFVGSHCNEDHFEDSELQTLYGDIMHRYQKGEPITVESYSRREHPYPELMGEIILERHTISEFGMKKKGVTIHKDADPVRTARGALKSLKISFLERRRRQLLDDYREAAPEKKSDLQEWIKMVTLERNRYQKESLVSLFPEEHKPEGDDSELSHDSSTRSSHNRNDQSKKE